MAELLTASSLLALVALTALEIVLGVDNLVFIAILTGRLPPENRSPSWRASPSRWGNSSQTSSVKS